MMKKIFYLAIAAVSVLASCKKEESPEALTETKIIASLSQTKVTEDGAKLLWSKGDKIAVYDGEGMREFTLSSGAGSSTATFSGKMLSGVSSVKAVFPYSSAKQDGTFTVPVTQSISSGASVDPSAIVCTAPSTETGKTLSFTAAVALLRVNTSASTTSVSVALNGGSTYKATLPGTAGSYDIAVKAGSYSGYGLTRIVGGKSSFETSTDKLSLTANCVTSIGQPLTGTYGYVKYSDGTPAASVAVSDGFSVVVTDSNGLFNLTPTSDCRYIYISYPSDAKITTIGNGYAGCPDFFKKYAGDGRYDFTLERQEVETQFNLFAMADPQAHYTARGTQKSADVVRFNAEAVPDINKKIAASSIPCYGVTLGDIVYSETSRNSNPGLTTMRTYFSNIKMPVFQTMGNHDFTYFYGSSNPLKTDESSSTLFLAAQRKFEDCFGPVNLSFNRGDVHVVCMRNVMFDSTTDASDYHCGFTSDQYLWLKADLANVSKDKMVILCVHIPLSTATSGDNVTNVLNLVKQYKNATIFSGHTHYYRGYANAGGTGMYEHIHSAICGQWWWSKIEGDGCPNGYTIYNMDAASIKDAYFTGFNEGMNTRDYQMRIYKGNIKAGGQYSYFQWPYDAKTYLINVFSGDARWKVKVYENGTYAGTASQMSMSRTTFSAAAGNTYNVPTSSSQDWWAIGYHIGVCKRGSGSSTSYYTSNAHMWKYVASSADAKIKVEATDPYGNVYTSEEVFTNNTYPDYVKAPLTIF